MPPPLIIVGGIFALGYLVKQTGDLMDDTAKLGRVVVAGGVVYVAYKVATR